MSFETEKLTSRQKRILKSSKRRVLVDSIEIGLASPEQIRDWSRRILPNKVLSGEVLTPKTVDYKTLKPIKNGLFCEKIFGPTRDFICSCGKKRLNKSFCPECDVEHTEARVRRYRLGHINLISPVTHVWYLRGRPSYIATLLGKKKRSLEALAYCTIFLPEYKNYDFLNSSNKTSKTSFLNSSNKRIQYNFGDLSQGKEIVFQGRKSQRPVLMTRKNLFTRFRVFWPGTSNMRPFEENWKGFAGPGKAASKMEAKANAQRKQIEDVAALLEKTGRGCFSRHAKEKGGGMKEIQSFSQKSWSFHSNTLKVSQNKNPPFLQSFFFISHSGKKGSSKIYLRDHVLKKKQSLKLKKSSINPFFNFFNYSKFQTLPISQTFACDLDERSRFLNYTTSFPASQDRRISIYSGIEKTKRFEIEIEEILSYTGGEAIRQMINRFDMGKLRRFLNFEIEALSLGIGNLRPNLDSKQASLLKKIIKKRARHWRRLKLAQIFSKSCKRPEWMILSALPVLPPDLRPILRLDGDVLVVSDLNQLYQKVLFRNSRFKRLGIVTVESVAYAKGLLQEAVDALLDNGKGGAAPMLAPNDRPLKSLSDILKGKKGRFRQNLLGKRVDYSGRSVIVVGPKQLLHQCGLPREMALELFQPFIIRKILARGFAKGIGTAKKMIHDTDPIVWEILSQLVRQHPILLNRAPTLHRLGIQAFQPFLVSGRAILLHPLVCTAFNADFDGDQMAVHIPLSAQARAESWKLLWSRNNILSPATGQPVLLPSQDMVLGCYYLTQWLGNIYTKNLFESMEEVKKYYDQGLLSIHEKIWMRVEGGFENGNNPEKPIEFQVQSSGFWRKIGPKYQLHIDSNGEIVTTLIQTTPGRVLINEIFLKN